MGERYLLLTIVFSHFNEKVRWAFAYYRVPYTEHRLLPGFHMLSVNGYANSQKPESSSRTKPTSPYSTPCLLILDETSGKLKQSIQESSEIIRYLSVKYSSPDRPDLYLSCGAERETVITDLVKHYDETIGAAARTYAYYDMLAVSQWRAMIPFAVSGFKNDVGFLQSVLWMLITPLIIMFFGGSEESCRVAEKVCRKEFEAASRLLKSSPYLAGERLSAADITFAALSYPILGVTHEEGYQHFPPDKSTFSGKAKTVQQSLRATKAGQHVMRLFKEERFLDEVAPLQKKNLFGLW